MCVIWEEGEDEERKRKGRGRRGVKRKFPKHQVHIQLEVDIWSMVQLEQSLDNHNIQ